MSISEDLPVFKKKKEKEGIFNSKLPWQFSSQYVSQLINVFMSIMNTALYPLNHTQVLRIALDILL